MLLLFTTAADDDDDDVDDFELNTLAGNMYDNSPVTLKWRTNQPSEVYYACHTESHDFTINQICTAYKMDEFLGGFPFFVQLFATYRKNFLH